MNTLPRSSEGFKVVPIAEEHISGFRAALDAVCRERRYLAFLEAPTPEECAAFVREHIERKTTQFVALIDNRVLGWCDVVPDSRPVSAHCGVLGMGVLAGYRGQGIGTALMAAALKGAQQFGLTRVELTVREDNTTAIRLYERFGFVIEGIKRNAILVDGSHENLVCMAILFSGQA